VSNELRILAAEDNPVNQKLLTKILESFNLDNFIIVPNGEEAVKKVFNEEFDIILMDIQMPKMGGIEACKLIREQYTKEELPIIGVSANSYSEDINIALEAQMNDYIAKPINIDKLKRVLVKYSKNNSSTLLKKTS
jgi:CheY-like chemotaxis protein